MIVHRQKKRASFPLLDVLDFRSQWQGIPAVIVSLPLTQRSPTRLERRLGMARTRKKKMVYNGNFLDWSRDVER